MAVVACVGDSSSPMDGGTDADLTGTLDHACYNNGSCNAGLTCISNVCVSLDSGQTDAGMDSTVSDAASDAADGFDGYVFTPPSCEAGGAGMTNCGEAGTESCCTSLEVPGGTYDRSYTWGADGGLSGQGDPATISPFRLDKYDVTVGRFRQFVAAVGGGYVPPNGSGKHTHISSGSGLTNSYASTYESGWTSAYASSTYFAPTNTNLTSLGSECTWTPTAGSQENLPINCMTWQEAYAFCIWDDGFLPTEAEWQYAASGGAEDREYAWGGTPPGTMNQYAIYSCFWPSMAGTCTNAGAGTLANIAPVGSAKLGAGKWGHLDLNGELAQDVLDYNPAGSQPYASCTDCVWQNWTPGVRYYFRGGFFNSTGNPVPSNGRNCDWPARSVSLTFRCARTP